MSGVLNIVDLSNVEDSEDDCVLESVTYLNQKEIDKRNFNYIYEESPLFAEFIEKCYEIENSKGMSRIINKTLIKLYNKTNKAFRTSPDFEKIIKRSISMLETKPVMICNHIKRLRDILIASTVRKRIKPITLSTNLEDRSSKTVGILKRKNSFGDHCKVSKVVIIEADTIEDLTEENQPINNNIEKNTIIDCEKENKSLNELGGEEDNKLLVPQKVVEIGEITEPLDIEKIKKIEKEIARCKTEISKLDDQEVDDDSVNSPYIKSEKLKAKIVILYEQLCNLTGNQTVKKRKINLRVIEGHPEGPVRCLETFLNNNIGSDGVPPFPDFSDVVECVGEANSKDNLGWTKHQVLHEARALFTQCGRALQRRRQNREWQDLLYKVKLQRCDDDPADSDPALLKRLEENRRAATKKESEILERYSMMQTVPQNHVTVSKQLSNEISDKTDNSRLEESMSEEMNLSHSDISHNLSQDNESHANESHANESHANESHANESHANESHANESQVNESKANESNAYESNAYESNAYESNANESHANESYTNESTTEEGTHVAVPIAINEIKIKKEPEEEIEELLEQLGDNFTRTIVEIEDSFLIIEISDSSDDEGS